MAVKLHQVHTLGLIHGDVKADNIAIINLDPVQVTPLDYGLCVPLCSAKRSKRTGGVQYDPKLLAGDIAKCPETDIYSIGILIECLSTAVPHLIPDPWMAFSSMLTHKDLTMRPSAMFVAKYFNTYR